MAKTATKTATKKTSKTATKTANKTIKVKKAKAKPEFVTETPVQKAVVLNETKASHKAKKETPSFEKIIAPLLAGIEENQVLIHDNAKLGATYWKGIGDYLIELQKAWVANGGDISWRGKNRTKNPISSEHPESFPEFRERVTSLNKYHASDAVKIAQNWSFAAQIDPEEIAIGGVNKIKSKIDEVINGKKKGTKKQGPATSETSKKNAKKSDAKDDAAIDLSSLMTDPKAFGAMIGKLVNSKYTDEQKAAFIKAAGEHIIIAETK